MLIVAAGRTDAGRSREQNEDTFAVEPALGLYCVCDGMGGHEAGEVAALVALDALTRMIRHRPFVTQRVREGNAPPDTLMQLVDRATRAANLDVLALAREHDPYHGMGCTLTALLAAGEHAALTSVGDSRFYLRRHGQTQQLTVDHTMAEELKRAGVLTPEQMRGNRYARLLSRAIGIEDIVHADTFTLDLVPGDRFVICTDGLSDYLEDETVLDSLLAAGTVDEIADRLVGFANEAGGADNITVVVGAVEP